MTDLMVMTPADLSGLTDKQRRVLEEWRALMERAYRSQQRLTHGYPDGEAVA